MNTATLILGSITGLTYAILAVGLILIYRSNRFVNFAHGNLGALAATLFAKLVIDVGLSYWVALPIVLSGAAAAGGLIELTIVRRLFDAPRLVLVVATIALSQLFFFLSQLKEINADRTTLVNNGFPQPFEATYTVGGVVLHGAHFAILIFVPLLAAGLTAFLRYTAWGQAIRASAENPDAARLAGISVRQMSTVVWVIAGLLAAWTALMLAPLRATFATETMGPSVLIRALGVALVARMSSLPMAFAAALALGIAEAGVFAATFDGGLTDVVVFGVVMAALLFRGGQLSRSVREGQGGIGFGEEMRAIPSELASALSVQRMQRVGIRVAVVGAILLPLVPILGFNTSRTNFTLAITLGYALIGVSMTILSGWGGQVSLGHFALVGVGAFTVARMGAAPWPLIILAAGAAAAIIAVLVGLPALRIQGLFLAVSTLAFGVVATGWLFQKAFFVGEPSGIFLSRPAGLNSERSVYYLALALLIGGAWLARNLRDSGPGRMLIAVRDNDIAARAAGVSAVWTRIASFALSGFLAGVSGVVFAYARQNYNATNFAPQMSLTVLLMVSVGGLGSITGAILGALFMFGIPALFGSGDLVTLFSSSVGVLIVLLYLPGGLAGVFADARDALARRLHRREHNLPKPPRTFPRSGDLVRVALGRTADQEPARPAAASTS